MMIEETVNRWLCCMAEQKTNQSCGEANRPKRILACLKPEYCTKWYGKSRAKQNKQAGAGLEAALAGRRQTGIPATQGPGPELSTDLLQEVGGWG